MICGRCGAPIRRGERYTMQPLRPELQAVVMHATCPTIRPIRPGDGPRDTASDLNLELRTPPEAS